MSTGTVGPFPSISLVIKKVTSKRFLHLKGEETDIRTALAVFLDFIHLFFIPTKSQKEKQERDLKEIATVI